MYSLHDLEGVLTTTRLMLMTNLAISRKTNKETKIYNAKNALFFCKPRKYNKYSFNTHSCYAMIRHENQSSTM